MEPSEQFTITKNRLNSSEFFLRSPFRNPYFLVVTFILMCMISISFAILVRAKVPLSIELSLASAFFFLIPPWVFALRIHKQIYLLLTEGQTKKLELGSPLDVALSAASNMINMGLGCAFAGALMFLSVLSQIVAFR